MNRNTIAAEIAKHLGAQCDQTMIMRDGRRCTHTPAEIADRVIEANTQAQATLPVVPVRCSVCGIQTTAQVGAACGRNLTPPHVEEGDQTICAGSYEPM